MRNRHGRSSRLAAWLLISLALIAGCATGPQQPTETQQRLVKAQAMFAERCKTAGENIYRTVDNVEGVFLMKLRPSEMNFGDQFALDDPYGRDFSKDGYIESFLRGNSDASFKNAAPEFRLKGYLFADAADPNDGRRYRYTGRFEEPWQTNKAYLKGYIRFVVDRAPSNEAAPPYGVTYDDISTREEREFWIAGSSLRIIDMNTGEVMAERIGYMMDTGQGNRGGGRSPWLLAANHSCPQFRGEHASSDQTWQTDRFVEKVLKPAEGSKNVD